MKIIKTNIMSLFKRCLILIVILTLQLSVFSQNLNINRIIKTEYFHDTICDLWGKFKPFIEKSIDDSKYNTYKLYQVQIATDGLLNYAFEEKKYALVDELLELYLSALTSLDTVDRYRFAYFYLGEEPIDTVLLLNKTYAMWIDGIDTNDPAKENILSISQFLALVSDAIFNIALIPTELRSETMKQFVHSYSSVLDSHYQRWVFGISVYNLETGEEFQNVGPFQRRGWGCRYNNSYIPSRLTHKQLIDLLLEKECGNNSSKKYCNSVTDTDLWIIAGVSSFVAAHLVDSALVGSISNLHFYKNIYLPIANDLIISRISTTNILNFEDSLVWGADFDNGIADDYPDNRFAGYNNPNVYPTINDVSWAHDLGWDFSHSRRFVNVFQTLYDTKNILGFNFPSSNIMAMFANQFAYKVFNKDFEYPLFSNFFDGTNGWFRVGYASRPNFGYGPSDFSTSTLTGGFCNWSVYNPDINKIANSLYSLIHTNDTTKRIFFNQHYEKNRWNNDTLTNLPIREQLYDLNYNSFYDLDSASLFVLLSFYSSIAHPSDQETIYTKKLDNIIIYPNPSSDYLYVISDDNISELLIFDLNGREVYYQKCFTSVIIIETSNLINGTYILNIRTENNDLITKKIIIV